jgi:hemoglobin
VTDATAPDAPLYDRVGGLPFFERLVARFYQGVALDVLLRPLYPDEDLGPAQARLTLFLVQYWGGPTTYSDARGHPRLRLRHAPFVIGEAEKRAWLRHMTAAVDESGTAEPERSELLAYFEMASRAMINQP